VTTVTSLSPAGLGALVVLELTGGPLPDILRDRNGRSRPWPPAGRHLVARLHGGDGVVDEVLVLGRRDGAELHVHGGQGVPAATLALLAAQGVKVRTVDAPATPASLAAARCFASARWGPLSRLAGVAREALHSGTVADGDRADCRRAVARAGLGQHLAHPPRVRLVGRPNAGKSTLFNALVGRHRALVSPQAGTTRDTVTATVAFACIPVELEDTAGASAPWDPGDAQLVIHLLSEVDEPPAPGEQVLALLGRADQRPGGRGVSGLTGQGLETLVEAVIRRLGLSDDPEDHAWAPPDRALAQLFERVLELPGPSGT
jgi:hypothetical protein